MEWIMEKTVFKITLMIIAGIFLFPMISLGKMDIRYTDDSFKIKTNAQSIKIGGTLMWDVDSAGDVFWDSENIDDSGQTHSEIRRACLNIKTKMSDNWKAELSLDFADDDDASAEVKDAYVEYSGWHLMNISVGQNKEPFGIEAMTSLKNISFVERSMASDAFRPGHNIGISLNADTNKLIWQVGVYQAQDREDDSDTYAVSGRLAVVPWKTDTGFFHVGISGSCRDFDGTEFEIKESAQIHTADNIIYSDGIDTDRFLLCGTETAFCMGPFSFQAEYMLADVNAVEENDDATFDGYYFAASWFLTGETRPFRNGVWKRVKPESSYGAWELVTRYSCLDAAENGQGTSADTYTLGVNWHINPNIRLMNNYTYLWVTDESTQTETTGDAVSVRVQCVF